ATGRRPVAGGDRERLSGWLRGAGRRRRERRSRALSPISAGRAPGRRAESGSGGRRGLGSARCLSGFGGAGARAAAAVAVAEPVAVALEAEDLGVVDERSIMAAATVSSPKISPQAEKGLLLVTISEARS